MEPLPAIFDDCYEIVGELGQGTTGIVYEARDIRLKHRVALKVPIFSPDDDRSVKAQRFLRECRALAQLTSGQDGNIPRLHQVAEAHGRIYCVRDLVQGSNLEQRAVEGSLDLRAGLTIIAEVARVVQWVHGRGFVHRNLCPENVLIDRNEIVWLIGFGRVGLLAGSDWAAPGAGTPAEVDVRGLQDLLQWLFRILQKPDAAGLQPAVLASVASAEAFAASVVGHLRSGTVEPTTSIDRPRD